MIPNAVHLMPPGICLDLSGLSIADMWEVETFSWSAMIFCRSARCCSVGQWRCSLTRLSLSRASLDSMYSNVLSPLIHAACWLAWFVSVIFEGWKVYLSPVEDTVIVLQLMSLLAAAGVETEILANLEPG